MRAARLRTFTPLASALRIAFSMNLFIPSNPKGKKYCKYQSHVSNSSLKTIIVRDMIPSREIIMVMKLAFKAANAA